MLAVRIRLTVLLVWLASGITARGQITLSGRVVNETNTGVAGARISLRMAGHSSIASVSDPTGAFSITLPAPGRYLAQAECEGYFPLRDHAVEVTSGTTELRLELSHVRELFQSMKVSASPQAVDVDQTAAERKLTGLEILDVPYTPTRDFRRTLELMPSVIQDSTGSLHFDGGAENQTLYTLDGFNVGDPLTGRLAAKLSVESVRLVNWSSGRYSPEFGKGSAGVLAIHTDMGDDQWRYSATNFVPGVDTYRGLHLGTFAPRLNLTGPVAPGRVWFSEHFDTDYSVSVIPGLPSNADRTSSFEASNVVRLQANITPSNIFFGTWLQNYLFAPDRGLGVLSPQSTTNDQRSRLWFFSAKDQIYFSRGMLLEVGYAEDRTFLRVIPQGSELYQLTPYGARGNAYTNSTQWARRGQFLTNLFLPSFELAGRHQVKTGIDIDRLGYRQNTSRTGYQVLDQNGILVRQTVFGGSGAFSQPGLEAAWYALDSWKLKPNLVVEAGIREDWDELVRRYAASPRVSFSWAPFASKTTKISGGYAIVHDATDIETFARPRDQYALDTNYNPDGTVASGPLLTVFEVLNRSQLRVPSYQNWTAGFERRLPRNIDLNVTAIRKRGSDGFTYLNIPGPPPAALMAQYEAAIGIGQFDDIYNLSNTRRDIYDAVGISAKQRFGEQYEWMASYTWSRALSNAVVDPNLGEPLQILNNTGPLNWDTPNRFLTWGYLPTWWENWAVAFSLQVRTGFPYSVVNGAGEIVGPINASRFPVFFDLDFHVERKFKMFRQRWALRGGLNNLTDHNNPTAAETVPGQPVQFLGSEGRHFVFRLRWIGKEAKN